MRRFFVLLVGILALAGPLVSPSTGSIVLQPLTIKRLDYLANEPATDRFTFPDPFPSVELNGYANPPYAAVTSVVYPRGDTIQVEITVCNPNGIATVGEFRFENAVFAILGVGEIELEDHIEGITVPAQGAETVTVTLEGMPDTITMGTLEADVTIDPTSGMWLDGGLVEDIYLVQSAPVGLMEPVWLEVLDDACLWLEGLAGSDAEVAEELTFGLNYNMVFVYDGGPPHYFKKDGQDAFYYLLKKLFDNRESNPYWTNGDCRDVSGYLHLLMQRLGLSNALAEEWPTTGDLMWTNPVCPIGDDMTQSGNYDPTAWTFHQVVLWSSSVYDSCASQVYDLSGDAYMNPPAGWSPSGYWQTENGSWPGPTGYPYRYFGLVDGYVIVNAETDPPTGDIYPSQQVGRSEVSRTLSYLSAAAS